jgi:hypothetical protein
MILKSHQSQATYSNEASVDCKYLPESLLVELHFPPNDFLCCSLALTSEDIELSMVRDRTKTATMNTADETLQLVSMTTDYNKVGECDQTDSEYDFLKSWARLYGEPQDKV